MTRINTVPPKLLSKPHLMAEYRELPRIFTAVLKLVDAGKTPADIDIPKRYCLGKGHVTFFYDKCAWLYIRFISLHSECRGRDISTNIKNFHEICDSAYQDISVDWWGEWKPTPEDHYLNMARLANRSKLDSVYDELDTGYAQRHDTSTKEKA